MQAEGVHTKAGTWAYSEAEAEQIEAAVDADEKWVASLEGRDQWLNRPAQPPGLLGSGLLLHYIHTLITFRSWISV